jgi:uncharacterized protein (TIGR00251 family)
LELPAFKRESGGLLIVLKVKPRGRHNAVDGVREGQLLLSVTAAPADGEANAAVLATFAKALRISKSSLELVRGHKSREKTIRISGIDEEDLRARLQAVLTALAG